MDVEGKLGELVEKHGVRVRLTYEGIGKKAEWSLHTWPRNGNNPGLNATLVYAPTVAETLRKTEERLRAQRSTRKKGC